MVMLSQILWWWTWVDPARGVSAGVELGCLDRLRVSLKSGFQLNPWLSSKRTRKMTEVHDMVRSLHPAKPFHFGPFVSLQLLIFIITPPDITPTSDLHTRPHHHTNWTKKKKTEWDLKTRLADWSARVRPWDFTAQCNVENIREISTRKGEERWGQRGKARGSKQRRRGRRQRHDN